MASAIREASARGRDCVRNQAGASRSSFIRNLVTTTRPLPIAHRRRSDRDVNLAKRRCCNTGEFRGRKRKRRPGMFIHWELTDSIGAITLDQPAKRNALSGALIEEILVALER